MNDIAIRVENLGKQYRIAGRKQPYQTIREALAQAASAPFRRIASVARGNAAAENRGMFWALKDVSFEVKQGEVVGIIGRNGAGKSTLLKILSRITEPTTGQALLYGRVGSLLEVGTGFHPELTGRENIFLSGAIQGMRREEIKRKFDEIVAFAEVEQFVDTPVKHYSSGMYLRLAFAVAAHLEPEILLVDEVLAVGDVGFQKKCMGKMGEANKTGKTVFFVSHNMGAIKSLCKRAILLDNGKIVVDSDAESVVSMYVTGLPSKGTSTYKWDNNSRPGTEYFVLNSLRLMNEQNELCSNFEPSQPIGIEMEYELLKPAPGMRLVLQFAANTGEIAFTSAFHNEDIRHGEPGTYKAKCIIPGNILNTGVYIVRLWAGIPGQRVILAKNEYFLITIAGAGNQGSAYPDEKWPGVVCPALQWSREKM